MAEETEGAKYCPFTQQPCMEAKCMLWMEMMRQNPKFGTMEKFHQCGLLAQPVIMMAPPQGRSHMPGILGGG